MLIIFNLLKNLLTLINVIEEKEIINRIIFDGIIKNLHKFQKSKNMKKLLKARRLKQTF